MRRIHVGLIAAGLCGAGLAWAASSVVVTNPPAALSASMQLAATTDGDGCFVWNVTGQMKPSFRGFGSRVQLLCQRYSAVGTDDLLLFPNSSDCDGPCPPAQADACGNFSFQIHVCGTSPQLDNSYFCTFIAHVDAANPKACGNGQPPSGAPPKDPNATVPCADGFCPSAQ